MNDDVPDLEKVRTPSGERWRWRHPLIRNNAWSRTYLTRPAAVNGRAQSLRHLRKQVSPDGDVCVSIDGARVHMSPDASAADVTAVRGLISAVKKITPEQLEKIEANAKRRRGQ